MKRLAAISLLLTVLFSQTELWQLAKLPVLIEHFQEHRSKDPGISFKDFIVLHYFSGDVMDEDYHRDMQLPFKETPSNHNLYQFAAFPDKNHICLKSPLISQNKIRTAYFESIPSIHSSDIWQPPKPHPIFFN